MWATGQSFCLTVVYGLNQLEFRKILWSELAVISHPVKPWLVIVDFNSAFDVVDRIGGKVISPKELEDARKWLDLGIVEEMKLLGSYYTRSNNQDGNNRIFSKLDRVFINEDWLDTFPNVNAIANWEVVSDHCAIILKHISVHKNGLRPFRFFNMWTSHPQFKTTILASWNNPLPLEGCGLQQVSRKLQRLVFVLKRFNWRIVGDIVKQYEESKLLYQQAKSNLFTDPKSQNLSEIERAAHLEFKKQEAAYASYLYQKSKVDWLRFGDENSALFYADMKKRKALNRIVSFVDETGRVEVDYPKVISHFTQHFQSFLGGASAATGLIESSVVLSSPILRIEDQSFLIKPFTYQEVKTAMFSIRAVKSPGPDGFGVGFYKSLWSVIGKEVSTAMIEFFDIGYIPKSLNSTILALIPKVSQPSNASEYRPIACCNTLYKCISKMLCNKLIPILPKLINQNQGAFVKNKTIAHNVLILQDLLKGIAGKECRLGA
ncbi:uncharacterized protein LOC133785191 [Humulus lupulus]|uniref:uncharacterized protein LOC133785191 n=1 Tax=Humulus lupulus TaxID=3486 RepID=UPI002B405AA6|nr:uncharacterized protein LOC133785191 [Humulus lupulus]